MILFDTFALDGVRRTADGYLAAFARVARTGIQEYKGSELGRPDLGVVRVYRPPEEVFHSDALKSFAHRPVTLKHPRVPVTAKNWKRYAGGQTGEAVVRDGEFVRVPMVMMDQQLIDAYEKDGVKELSMGYSTDLQWRTGMTDAGEPYDAVQTAIRGNHLAVVPLARGGDKLRIGDTTFRGLVDKINQNPDDDEDEDKTVDPNADEDDDDYVDDANGDVDTTDCPKCGAEIPTGATDCPECHYHVTNDGAIKMKIITVDGLSVSVADDQGASIIERHVNKLETKVKDSKVKVSDAEAVAAKATTDLADAQKALSTKDGEIAVLKKQLDDAKVTPVKLDQMVKDRLSVIDAAAPLLDKTFAFDGKSVEEIKRATVEAYLGDAAKGMDETAIAGAFVAATLVKDNKRGGSMPIRDSLRVAGNHRPGTVNDARETAYDEKTNRLSNAWRGAKAS